AAGSRSARGRESSSASSMDRVTGRFTSQRWRRRLYGVLVVAAAVPALTLTVHSASSGEPHASRPEPGLKKIKHVVMILQENRSFDPYFGTFPGADGIPQGVCVSDPRGGCVRPFHLKTERNVGGPHALKNAIADIDNGAMDGFVQQAVLATKGC